MIRRLLSIVFYLFAWASLLFCIYFGFLDVKAVLENPEFTGGFSSDTWALLQFESLGNRLAEISLTMLNLIQSITERYVSVFAWDNIVFPILLMPAVVVTFVSSIVFNLFGVFIRGWRKRRTF